MNVFRFIYNCVLSKWRNRTRGQAGSVSMRQLQAYSAIVRLERSAQLSIDIYEPRVDMDMELHLALSANRHQYQNFLRNMHSYVNYLRSAFNGAAAEGLAVSPSGDTHLSPIQPDEAIGCHVIAGNSLICIGAFNRYDHKIETYRN